MLQGSPHKTHAGFRSPGPHSDFLRSLTLDGAGMRRSVAPSPSILLNLLRAFAARARGSFLLEKKGTKDSPKRRYPLWILLQGDSPLGNFAKRSSLPLTAPPVGGYQVLHLPLRAAECLRLVHLLATCSRGFKRGLPLSLEVSGPSGPDCVFGDFLHTRKSPRCGARSSTNRHCRNSPAMNK